MAQCTANLLSTQTWWPPGTLKEKCVVILVDCAYMYTHMFSMFIFVPTNLWPWPTSHSSDTPQSSGSPHHCVETWGDPTELFWLTHVLKERIVMVCTGNMNFTRVIIFFILGCSLANEDVNFKKSIINCLIKICETSLINKINYKNKNKYFNSYSVLIFYLKISWDIVYTSI